MRIYVAMLRVPNDLVSSTAAYDGMQSMKINILERLEPLIRNLITADGCSEALLWLCNAVASISTISHQEQLFIFYKSHISRPLPCGSFETVAILRTI